ncbi:MAG: coproporphyrinogen III oxidase, partial [Pseudomonadota bacterium]
YQLTIEPGTRFATDVRRGVFEPLDDDAAADLFALTQDMTRSAGLPAYETSNHATPGSESRHNLTYWRYQDYCGIGPGAHGRRAGMATIRHKKPENFLSAVSERQHGIAEARMLDPREQASEALLMGLRLVEGVDLAVLAERFGFARGELVDAARVEHCEQIGLMRHDSSRLFVTEAGRPVLDAILAQIVADDLVSPEAQSA